MARDAARGPDWRRRSRLPPMWFYDERGSRALRRDHPAARVLPDPGRARDPRPRTPPRSPAQPAPTRSSSSVRARRRRRGCCSTRCADAGTLERFVPFDVSEETLRDAAAAIDGRVPGVDVHAVVGDFHAPPRRDPARRAPARRLPRRHDRQPRAGRTRAGSSPTSTPASTPTTALLLGTDLVKDVGRLVAAYDDAGRRHRRVQPQRAARCSTASSAPTSTSTRFDARRPLERRRASGSRCGCGRNAIRRCRIDDLDLDRHVRRRRGDAHRDQRQVHRRPGCRRAVGRGIRGRRELDRS